MNNEMMDGIVDGLQHLNTNSPGSAAANANASGARRKGKSSNHLPGGAANPSSFYASSPSSSSRYNPNAAEGLHASPLSYHHHHQGYHQGQQSQIAPAADYPQNTLPFLQNDLLFEDDEQEDSTYEQGSTSESGSDVLEDGSDSTHEGGNMADDDELSEFTDTENNAPADIGGTAVNFGNQAFQIAGGIAPMNNQQFFGGGVLEARIGRGAGDGDGGASDYVSSDEEEEIVNQDIEISTNTQEPSPQEIADRKRVKKENRYSKTLQKAALVSFFLDHDPAQLPLERKAVLRGLAPGEVRMYTRDKNHWVARLWKFNKDKKLWSDKGYVMLYIVKYPAQTCSTKVENTFTHVRPRLRALYLHGTHSIALDMEIFPKILSVCQPTSQRSLVISTFGRGAVREVKSVNVEKRFSPEGKEIASMWKSELNNRCEEKTGSTYSINFKNVSECNSFAPVLTAAADLTDTLDHQERSSSFYYPVPIGGRVGMDLVTSIYTTHPQLVQEIVNSGFQFAPTVSARGEVVHTIQCVFCRCMALPTDQYVNVDSLHHDAFWHEHRDITQNRYPICPFISRRH